MIEAIIFDLAEVCIQGLKGFEKVLSEKTHKDSVLIKESLVKRPRLIELFEGKISEEEYINSIKNELGLSIDNYEFKMLLRDYFTEETYQGTHGIIKEIKKQNIPIYLLSDHAKEWIDYIKTKDFIRLFDRTFFSFEIGKTKVSTESFLEVLKRINLSGEKVLFIDDSQNNIDVAKNAGISNTILFTSAESLRNLLNKDYNIKI
jgi:glucose-1-phosphatase